MRRRFDFEGARALAEEKAVDEARTAGPRQILLHGSIPLAAARLGAGDVQGAERALAEIQVLREDRRRRLDQFLEPLRLNLSSQVALACGDLGRARREAEELRELTTLSGEPTYLALAERTLGEVARRGAAADARAAPEAALRVRSGAGAAGRVARARRLPAFEASGDGRGGGAHALAAGC